MILPDDRDRAGYSYPQYQDRQIVRAILFPIQLSQ